MDLKPCPACNGLGYDRVTYVSPMALFAEREVCEVCGGTGKVSDEAARLWNERNEHGKTS